MQNFRGLTIWEKSLDLTQEIYKLTYKLPDDEKYGLTSQMRRAAVSVGANIAEGSGRFTKKDFRHFLVMSVGSLSELDYFVELSYRLGFLEVEVARNLYTQINDLRRMIISFRKKLTT